MVRVGGKVSSSRVMFGLISILIAVLIVLAVLAFAQQQAQASPTVLSVQPLGPGLTPENLANLLVGSGVTVTNVTYTGTMDAAGTFSGGTEIIGFEQGILLSTGVVSDVIGPNLAPDVTTEHFRQGDPDLEALAGITDTFDAVVLEFDVVPEDAGLAFNFVFASDEYNEFVGSDFNDVFAFFVNGINCANVNGEPVSINTINNGYPPLLVPPSNPQLYIDNDPFDGGGATLDTEMDGLTKVLTCNAIVTPGMPNHIKLAIADASDFQYDSNVFIQSGSIVSFLPPRSYLPIIQK